jgi:hypothetical protein
MHFSFRFVYNILTLSIVCLFPYSFVKTRYKNFHCCYCLLFLFGCISRTPSFLRNVAANVSSLHLQNLPHGVNAAAVSCCLRITFGRRVSLYATQEVSSHARCSKYLFMAEGIVRTKAHLWVSQTSC